MTIFARLVIVFWVCFYLYWAISARGTKKVVHRANRWVGFGTVVVVIIAILISKLPAFEVQLIPRTDGVMASGTVVCGLGIAFAIWARKHLGNNWSREPSIQAGHELVTSGPYRFVRHPIYTGILAAILGSVLVGGTVWLIMFAGILLMFVWRVKTEEEFMTHLFPQQYPDYKKRTKALIPFVW
ncbi:MAG: isoprenylcysteine carboxylmethyltransferase family protein [Bryobacteraceae bacterium]|jgi:protein-S-isoprenylcysteine O-methyltransferase